MYIYILYIIIDYIIYYKKELESVVKASHSFLTNDYIIYYILYKLENAVKASHSLQKIIYNYKFIIYYYIYNYISRLNDKRFYILFF